MFSLTLFIGVAATLLLVLVAIVIIGRSSE
jgi:hypothetical protein